ncbi:intermembrane lipid transfer protein VPS13A [Sphaerodactylus townsendi]|nr:intermembrane lipid transfer protein VPS13A [Sphaerodactylus townsendi]
MVFESVVVDVLNRFLGDYVVNLDSSQLSLGIWGGAVALKNLEIKENALYQFDVPFKVKAGHIGQLNLQIPWQNLYTQPVEAVLDGVYLLIVPTASIEYDAEKEEKQQLEAKQRELQRIEEAKQKIADQNKTQEKQDTFVEKLVTQVIKNLQLKISNIHIRYEDDITNKDIPLSFGVSLQNLSLQTSDQNWNPCIQNETAKLFYKLVRLDNFFAYWNVKSEMFYHGVCNESLNNLKHGVAGANVIPEGYGFVFRPISAKAKLRMNPRSDVDFSAPKLDLDVNLQDIVIELNKPQYFSIMELLESIDMMTRNLPYRKYRPNVPVHNNAKEWWEYAINGILEVNVKPKQQMWCWDHICHHRNNVKNYKDLYKIKITTKKPDEELLKKLERIEKILDVFNITLARQQAEVQAAKAGLRIYRPGAKQDEEESKGWFSWMWGWTGGSRPKKVHEPKGLEQLMTPQEKDKLYAAIGYSETAVDPTLPKAYEAMKLYVKLLSMKVSIRENMDKPELIKLALLDLRTTVTQRPGAEAIRFESSVSAFEVLGMAQRRVIPCLLSSRTVHSENNTSLFTIMFETNPLDENVNQKLRVESQPLEIIYDAMTINSLVDFFRPPSDVHLEQLTSATLLKLEEFREKTATGLVYIIETQKVLDLKINLMASYVIIPKNGFYEPKCDKLLLDLGHLKMTSKSRSNMLDVRIKENTLEEIMARAYDKFDIQLSSIQLLYSKHDENWEEARNLRSSSQHILQPLDVKMELSRAMVVTDTRMPKYKMFGELPLLYFNISDEKLKCILKLIDSIPKPEGPPDTTPPPSSQLQLSSLLTTPQMSTTLFPILELHSVAGSSESEEEFYDAPTSPIEDLPFFEAPLATLRRVGSMKKKPPKKESVRNMTDFQLRFEISEVSLQVCRLAGDIEKPILRLEILKLGTELKLRTYDMTATAFLSEICLICPEYIDDQNKPVYIITTLDNSTDDLLAIEYVKADINAPELKSTYKNVLQLMKVNFSSLDVHLHTEALLSTLNFLNKLLPKQEASTTEITQEKEEKREVLKKLTSKKTKYDEVCDLHICAVLSSLRIFIREQKRWICEICVEGLDSQVMMKKATTEISAKLKNITIMDRDEAALYTKALYITGKEVFSFRLLSYVDATDGVAYTNMNAVDSRVYLTVGCIQIVFVNRFVSAVLAFINNFQTAKEAITEATVQAAEKAATGVKELAQQSSRMALNVNIKAPVVIIPQSAISADVLVADFGLITIKNEFSLVKVKGRYNLPPVLDCIHVKLSELKLYRSSIVRNSLQKEIQLLQPLNLEVTVERNLAAIWYHDIPDIKIFGHLKPMNLILSQEDVTTILRTLNENLGESSSSAATVPELKEPGSSHSEVMTTSMYSGGGMKVVTSAVVETRSSAKVKTTLKLDFQFDSLTLVLYSPNSNQSSVLDQRDNALKLAEFKLVLISAAVKMLSDESMNASVKLTNCTLDDKRQTVQKATPRMVEMKYGSEKKVMVDISYKQSRDGTTVIDTVVQETHLCASIEFLLTVADVFLKATAESTAAQKNFKQQTLAVKEQAPVQPVSTVEINVVVKNPEIVFVADLTRRDAPALVVTAQFEVCMKNGPEMSKMTAAVKHLTMQACPFLPEMRKDNITMILQPCDLFFEMIQSGADPQKADLSVKSIILKVSPIILNTVITITSALFPTKETEEKDISPIPPDLWDQKDIKKLNMWFLEESDENQTPISETELVPTGETLQMKVDAVVITLEAGVGHRTVPMLLAKSSFSGVVRNWSTLIHLSSRLELEVHYYNEMFGVWEPLLEPLEVENTDEFRPWVLGMKMKKKTKKSLAESVTEEEHYKVPEYKTVINIYSEEQLNITLSKCGLLMLSNLGTAFAEAATQTSEIYKKDKAPFVLINSLGVSVVVLPSNAFSVLNVESRSESFHLENGQSLSMEYIKTKSEYDQFTAMTTLSSKVFYIILAPENHSTTDKIPLTKVGRSLYRVRHNDSGVVRSIVCQIDTIEGSKTITVHSPIQIGKSSIFICVISYSRDTLRAVETPNWYLKAVLEWMRANKLKLNPNKIVVLLVTNQSKQAMASENDQIEQLGGITVDITLSDHSTSITFSDYHDGAAPFLIINHTREMIEYGQSSLSVMEDSLAPNKAVLYTWAHPIGSRKLKWKCGKSSREVTQKDDLMTPIQVGNKEIYVVSFFEGLQRIILFTEDEKVFRVAYESEKVELAEQEIIVSLQDVGISLVNNYSKQEVAYIGITSSDVVWETKPKKKLRWKPLSVKQTDKLEKEFNDYCGHSPTENKIIELDNNIPVCLTPTGNNMKILQPNEIPVRRSFLPALKVQYSTSEHQSSFRVQIYRIQIQNQIPGAIFPFVFYPIKPPKSVTLDSEPKPFTDVSIVMRTAGHSQITRIKYFMVLIQEMDLRLDLGFLYALADFFTFSGEVPKDQELKLFKKDVEAVQEELKNVSSTDTSQISLYEYFHISPIKLHLSFSLSTGGEDSNKEEKRKELIPVQSLNLLLKSIGTTLTDVQDVVLKLAYFELNYHFCTTQGLQWTVIMHYSKQAIKQMYVLILGLDVLGNPFGFIRDLSVGVEAFFYEPYQGAIQGPEEFVEGMALGLKALVGGAVGGLAGAASRITGAMAKGVAAITMDEDYQQKRRETMNRQPAGLKEGITRGGKGLMSGFVSGITGIVTKPIRGAQKEGAAGFFKGVGKGLVGAVARPTGGIIDMASSTLQVIKRATNSSEDIISLRPPRFFNEDGVIRPYRLRDGAGSQMLQNIENGRFAKLRYFTHAMINNTDLLMVTKSGILFVTKGTFGQLTCEWQYSYDEFTKEPFIVDGRRLRIEAKERVKSVFHAKEFGKIINFRTSEDAKWILSKLEEVRESHSQ